MIVTLKRGVRIIGFAANVWQVIESDPLADSKRRVASACSLKSAFELALSEGMVEPGNPLSLAHFDGAIRDAAGRIGSLRAVHLAEGYFLEYATTADGTGRNSWVLFRAKRSDGGRRAKLSEWDEPGHAIAAAVWHAAFRERCVLTAPEVGPHLLAIARRLLAEGELAEPASIAS